tara:strand:- start:776 stop:922 length:147 start_codon:yes stop_codon:yes gene_type:complete
MLAKLRDDGQTAQYVDFDNAFARAGILMDLVLLAEDRKKTGYKLLVQS